MESFAPLEKPVRKVFPNRFFIWLPVVLLNLIVLANAWLHDPLASYDANAHQRYVRVISAGRLPVRAETKEFFSPPLAYLPAAFLQHVGMTPFQADKAWQILQVFYSVGICLLSMRIFLLLCPGQEAFAGLPVWLLGMFPVYYRTFAMPRSEPLVALLGMAALYLSLRLALSKQASVWHYAALGALCGLLVLARQWGFFLLPGICLPLLVRLWREKRSLANVCRDICVMLLALGLVGGWFYLHLWHDYGSITAFNREKKGLSMDRLREEISSVGQLPKTFSDPIRPALGQYSLPIFFADTWGDYWAYFLVAGYDTHTGSLARMSRFYTPKKRGSEGRVLTNQAAMTQYLGRVNLLAVVPSILLLAALFWALRVVYRASFLPLQSQRWLLGVPLLMIIVTLLGYLSFQMQYSGPKGDTVKASYLIQIFPLLALVGACGGVALFQKNRRFFRVATVLLILVTAHNSGAFLTRLNPRLINGPALPPAGALPSEKDSNDRD